MHVATKPSSLPHYLALQFATEHPTTASPKFPSAICTNLLSAEEGEAGAVFHVGVDITIFPSSSHLPSLPHRKRRLLSPEGCSQAQ